ncbi:MAG TPA: hypothetical protein VN694_02580 [Caulobacteraceae bacterium]|nr:hypothetical protein [Caulobacteraceae bacterium]
MTTATAAPERFDIGRVFSGGFAIVARRPLTFVILGALFAYLPTAATLWLTTNWLPPPTPGVVDFAATFRRLGIVEAIAIVFGGFSWVMQGSAAAAALSDFGDKPLGVGEALSRAAGRLPLVYVMGVLATLGIILGTFALIVPGVLLSLAWAVGGVVATVENTGFKAFGRSMELTRGYRIQIFLIYVVYGIAGVVVSLAARAIGGASLVGGPPLWMSLGVQPVASAIVQIFSVATLIAVYVELRGVKEGLAASSLASLFD